MKSAVIKTGGKQYIVTEKSKLKVEKLSAAGDVQFDTLLLADGTNVLIGDPLVGEKISGKVVGEGRTKKVIGIKYKRKTRQSKKFGHRQAFTEVQIDKI